MKPHTKFTKPVISKGGMLAALTLLVITFAVVAAVFYREIIYWWSTQSNDPDAGLIPVVLTILVMLMYVKILRS